MPVSMAFHAGVDGKAVQQASMQPAGESDERLVFAASPSGALLPLVLAAGFSPLLVKTPLSFGWFFWAAVVAALAVWAVRCLLWRERLTLDFVERRYTYSRGYWPNVATTEGALGEIKSVVLDVLVRSGSKGGDIVTWIVALLFDATKPLPVANFTLEAPAYACLSRLAKRLHVAALDRTGEAPQTIDWGKLDQPLAARREPMRAGAGRGLPPLPAGSRIAVLGEAPNRRIVLPLSGPRFQYLVLALMPLFPPWWTGMLARLQTSAPFIGFSLLFALGGVIAALTHREISETPDEIVIATRLFGLALSRRRSAKPAITDIVVKPVPSRRPGEELQIRAASQITNIAQGRLSAAELKWLEQALRAMLPSA